MNKLIKSLFYYVLIAIGISLTIKANIGVSSFNSLNVSVAQLCSLQIGTVTAIVNGIFLTGCLIVDREKNIGTYLLMVVSTLSFGAVLNGVYYSIFSYFEVSSYVVKILLFVIGVIVAGIATGQVVRIGVLTFPIEAFCQLMAKKTKGSFRAYRYGIDVVCVLISLTLSFKASLPIVVREGTIVSLFLLSGMINWSKQRKF